MSLQCPAGF